jgi:hypothetical protein
MAAAGLAPAPAVAGAWERAEGTAFVALSYGLERGAGAEEGTVAFYAEYGLPWRLTFGANLDQRPAGPHVLDLFLRRNVEPADTPLKIAVEAGVAIEFDGHVDDTTGQPVLTHEIGRPSLALHLGRGFGAAFGDGWWDMRIGAELPTGDAAARGAVDALVGLDLSPRLFATTEIWHDVGPSSTFTSVAPGVGARLTERATATLRVVRDVSGAEPDRLELGTWLDF